MVPFAQNKATKPGMSMSEAAQQKRAAGGAGKPTGKAARRMSKDKVREVFLGRLPTGGVAIEIGVWHGDFSATILDLDQTRKALSH